MSTSHFPHLTFNRIIIFSRWEDTISRISEKASQIKQQKDMERRIRKQRGYELPEEKPVPLDKDVRELIDLEKYIGDEDLKSMVRHKSGNLTEQDRAMLIPMRLIRGGKVVVF